MRRGKYELLAEELEVGMLVQHPDWRGTERMGAIEEVEEGTHVMRVVVTGTSKLWTPRKDEYVKAMVT
jgi:hypothetical protein